MKAEELQEAIEEIEYRQKAMGHWADAQPARNQAYMVIEAAKRYADLTAERADTDIISVTHPLVGLADFAVREDYDGKVMRKKLYEVIKNAQKLYHSQPLDVEALKEEFDIYLAENENHPLTPDEKLTRDVFLDFIERKGYLGQGWTPKYLQDAENFNRRECFADSEQGLNAYLAFNALLEELQALPKPPEEE